MSRSKQLQFSVSSKKRGILKYFSKYKIITEFQIITHNS